MLKKALSGFMALLALCALQCAAATARYAPLEGAAWMAPDETLYVFGFDNRVTTVRENADGGITVREMRYRVSGTDVQLEGVNDGGTPTLLLGEYSNDGLRLEGEWLTWLEFPEAEPAEAPGIAGGWTDADGEQILLLHPDGRVSGVDAATGELALEGAAYAHYGQYVALTYQEETVWLFYDIASDLLTDGVLQVHRVPPEEAAALGLDGGSLSTP